MRKAEFDNLTVQVNNTLVCRASSFVFLATDTLLCGLMVLDSIIIHLVMHFLTHELS